MITIDERGCTSQSRLASLANRALNRTTYSNLARLEREKGNNKKSKLKTNEGGEVKAGNWSTASLDERIIYIMGLLINKYEFPLNGASGLVGNLIAESQLIPNRLEGSLAHSPMKSWDHDNQNNLSHFRTFSPDEVLNRYRPTKDKKEGWGPVYPGVGIAQWTDPDRRYGLFKHKNLGPSILFNMEAQVDYLVTELKDYKRVFRELMKPNINVEDASDLVLLEYEKPKDKGEEVKEVRRMNSRDARIKYLKSLTSSIIK